MYAEQGKTRSAYHLIIQELGKTLGSDKQSFVDLLNNSGIQASISDSPQTLASKYADNICTNRKLMLGTSLLVQMKNQMSSADGQQTLSDDGVKTGYFVMRDYIGVDSYSNMAGDPVTAVAQGVGELAKLGTTAVEGGQKLRYARKYGALDQASAVAQKRQETKLALIQAQMKQKELEAEAQKKSEEQRSKTNRTILIVTGIVAVLAIGGALVYKLKK
jgi:predicted RecA/RadA family phage recombinase